MDSEWYSVCNDQRIDGNNILHPSGKSLEIECDTLDNILLNHRVDVIKMDIEGAEVLALKYSNKNIGENTKDRSRNTWK